MSDAIIKPERPVIKTVLAESAQQLNGISDSPLLEAEVLLAFLLDKNRTYLRTWPDKTLSPEQLVDYRRLIANRAQGRPIAYLTGRREFWSREFLVTPDVLIPRPETELLVELCLALMPANQPCRLLDLGTGSGIIAVTLAAERPDAQVSATDISPNALQVAAENAEKHQVGRIQFYLSNWFESIPDGQYDLIVSNPPYIAEDDAHLQQGDLRFEPKSALIASDQGLKDIRLIAEAALARLAWGGYLLLEHGYNQQQSVQKLLAGYGYGNIQTHRDLSGQPRVTSGQYLATSA